MFPETVGVGVVDGVIGVRMGPFEGGVMGVVIGRAGGCLALFFDFDELFLTATAACCAAGSFVLLVLFALFEISAFRFGMNRAEFELLLIFKCGITEPFIMNE